MHTFLRIIGKWEFSAHLANRMDGPEEEPDSRDTTHLGTSDREWKAEAPKPTEDCDEISNAHRVLECEWRARGTSLVWISTSEDARDGHLASLSDGYFSGIGTIKAMVMSWGEEDIGVCVARIYRAREGLWSETKFRGL